MTNNHLTTGERERVVEVLADKLIEYWATIPDYQTGVPYRRMAMDAATKAAALLADLRDAGKGVEWTQEPPEVDGYYWWFYRGGVTVADLGTGDDPKECLAYRSLHPIQPPTATGRERGMRLTIRTGDVLDLLFHLALLAIGLIMLWHVLDGPFWLYDELKGLSK